MAKSMRKRSVAPNLPKLAKPNCVFLEFQWMKALEKIHAHPSPEMDGQANYRVHDREDARPNTYISTQIEADRIRPS
jgi:hypothetical protein